MDVPSSLKKLLRLILRGFYDLEHTLVIDLLIRKIYMTEEEIEELIKFEKKQLRNTIAQLKNEKILKARIKMETGPDRKSKKQNYYYINYRGFVNVVKYKLDHMRRKIETEERDNTKRASFVCTQCKKTYTDLEADQLCDLTTGEFRCSYCGDIVEEDSSVLPKADSRLILAKFNEQIEPLYILLKEVEDLKLPAELLEPEPLDMVLPIKQEENKEWNSVDKNRGVNNAYEQMMLRERSLTVNIETVNDAIGNGEIPSNRSALDGKGKARIERPAWLTESTILDPNAFDSSLLNGNGLNGMNMQHMIISGNKKPIMENGILSNGISEDSSNTGNNNNTTNNDISTKEILEALLIYEKQNENSANASNGLMNGNLRDPFGQDKLYDHSDQDDSTEQYEIYRLPMVRVGGQWMPINEVEDHHLPLMSQAERDDFVRLSHEVYSHLYD